MQWAEGKVKNNGSDDGRVDGGKEKGLEMEAEAVLAMGFAMRRWFVIAKGRGRWQASLSEKRKEMGGEVEQKCKSKEIGGKKKPRF